ncbi:MAG: hypothetical protein HZC24_11490 [Rhodocyclales bacterium]|nr:hypothetical protein [Rhodocyclales bacterium]
MSAAPVAAVNLSDLLDAIDFVSGGELFDHRAFIDPDTGAIHFLSSEAEFEDVPDDIDTSDRYIAVPHKKDLDLGRRLALSFADEATPDEYGTVDAFFRKKGAYARFKDFLDARRLLERWYAYEASETEKAVRAWCADNGIALADEPKAT